jgi:hypothetical protein
MDAKYWQEPTPKEPTAQDFDLAAKMRDKLKSWISIGGTRKNFKFEHAAWQVAQYYRHVNVRQISTACHKVKTWVDFERRREARRMTESELAVFRSGLTWKPHMAAWRVFEGYMRDRVGDWPLICGTALGSTSAAFAALAGEEVGEFLELADHCARLCAELPEDWDPRPTERFPAGFPEERRVVYRATPFRRYTN